MGLEVVCEQCGLDTCRKIRRRSPAKIEILEREKSTLQKTSVIQSNGIECSSLNDLVQKLHLIFSSDAVNIEYVHALMSAYKSNPAEWLKFAQFDKYRYTRNLVDSGNGKFNLMILCWGEGHSSSIHDHTNSHCFMKMLAGSLSEVRFEWPNEERMDEKLLSDSGERFVMEEKSRSTLQINQVCYINDSLGLHRVENTSDTNRAVSLHLYCPPYDSCYVFNQRTGQRLKAPVTFWSIYGEKI